MKIPCVKGKREAVFQAAEYSFVVYEDVGKKKSWNYFYILSMYKQKKSQCALILFVPGNWDRSGVLAGRCPIHNIQRVLALMVWPLLCISWLVLEVVYNMGWVQRGLVGGMDYGVNPSTPILAKDGLGLGCSLWKMMPEEVAVSGSEATLVPCPPFVPSPCSSVDPHQSHLGYSCLLLILLPSPSNSL